MRELLFLESFFKKVIWGGHKMKDVYDYQIPSDNTGEAWIVSANQNGKSKIINGTYKDCYLNQLWEEHKELFGNISKKDFPILIKIIDANDNLSIQVHPDDAYCLENKNGGSGKTECWYILDCDKDADIIIGHNAKTKQELIQMIDKGAWDKLLKKFKINKGDFFFIPSGTIHAIRKGTLILEIQQNSDTTYRLYDYDRLENGKPRQLHLKESLDVINCPHKDIKTKEEVKQYTGYSYQKLVSCEFFTVEKWDIVSTLNIEQNYSFMAVNIIDGSGTVDGNKIKAGDCFIAPYEYGNLKFEGNLKIITTHI